MRQGRVTVALTSVVAVGLLLGPVAHGSIDDLRYKIKPGDANTWAREYGGGQLIEGGCGANGHRRCIAFTFDDGPDYHTTPHLLDMLDARHLRAAFFVVGHRLDGAEQGHVWNRDVLRETWRRGHLVGNHTYHHILLDGLRPETLTYEIDRTAALIEQVTGQRTWLFRAPFGALGTRSAVAAVFARGYTPVYWTLDTMDWAVNTSDAVLQNFRSVLTAHPRGGVVLMHDTHPWSVAAFPAILRELDARNAALVAGGEEPYQVVGLEEFYRPLGANAPRGQPDMAGHHTDSHATHAP